MGFTKLNNHKPIYKDGVDDAILKITAVHQLSQTLTPKWLTRLTYVCDNINWFGLAWLRYLANEFLSRKLI